jgi:hypothetical protein
VVLGSFGIVGGIQLLGRTRVAAGDMEKEMAQVLDHFPGMRAQPKEIKDAMKEAVPTMVKVDQRWKKRRVALAAADMLLSALLLAGALQGLRLLPAGRWLWLNASLALIPVELVAALMQILIARDNAQVMVAALVHASDVPQVGNQLAVVSKAMVGVFAGMYGAKAALLCAYYVVVLWRLTRPAAKALFVAQVPAGPRAS